MFIKMTLRTGRKWVQRLTQNCCYYRLSCLDLLDFYKYVKRERKFFDPILSPHCPREEP